jgi:CheY-like chemotaxis protein
MKLLLVDDEPWYTEALAAALEARGFECLTATDMTSGLEVLKSTDLSAVVTDIMMPPGTAFPKIDASESGFHFIEQIQKNSPGLPIVCLSVIADQAKIRLLAKRGVRYLRKGETPLSSAVEIVTAVAQRRRVNIKP